MQQACHNCPFRKDSIFNKTLTHSRKTEIAYSILHQDQPFICHKTSELKLADRAVCIGSAVALGDRVMDNVAYRLNAMYGRLQLNNLNREEIYTLEEWLEQNS